MPTSNTTPQALAWLHDAAPHATLARMHIDGTLAAVLPEVDCLYGVPQNAEHHPEIDTGVHIELTLEAAALLTEDPAVRFAALVHDLGKGLTPKAQWPQHISHEELGLEPVSRVCDRFGVPSHWKALSLLVCEFHLHVHRAFEMNPKSIVRFFRNTGMEADPTLVEPFLLAVEADKRGRAGRLHSAYRQGAYMREAFIALRARPMPDGEPLDSIEGQAVHVDRLHAVKALRKKYQALA